MDMIFSLDDPSITQFFQTYEARETAFNQAVGALVPVRYKGPGVFWQEFQRIIQADASADMVLPAFITSNPRDCLAFGSARQILYAARATVCGDGDLGIVSEASLARQFGLESILDQPIRTLSGGETVRLALAKAMLMADGCDRLVVSSPFCWMSANHLPHLVEVVECFHRSGKPVRILAMAGETSQEPVGPRDLPRLAPTRLKFTLRLENVRLFLGTPLNAITDEPGIARVMDGTFDLTSPCLWVGDNGQGKSLVAKALCGALAMAGEALISRPGCSGRAGLLFQDVVIQTLMRTMDVLARRGGKAGGPTAKVIYKDICLLQRQWMKATAVSATPERYGENSLLAVKTMLIAVNLSHAPAALILDEPDWGLSRPEAEAFVLAVIERSHGLGIPVIIISHKPWWRLLAADILEVTKDTRCDPPLQMTIRLTPKVQNRGLNQMESTI